MYIIFGLLAAKAFKRDSEDMLTLLAGDGVSYFFLLLLFYYYTILLLLLYYKNFIE